METESDELVNRCRYCVLLPRFAFWCQTLNTPFTFSKTKEKRMKTEKLVVEGPVSDYSHYFGE
jgi:hypothetical protein